MKNSTIHLTYIFETNYAVFFRLQGATLNVAAPTISELARVYNIDIGVISTAVAMRGVGRIPGCFLGGFLFERFLSHCDAYLLSALLLGGACVISTVFVPFVELMGLCFGIQGFIEMSCFVCKY